MEVLVTFDVLIWMLGTPMCSFHENSVNPSLRHVNISVRMCYFHEKLKKTNEILKTERVITSCLIRHTANCRPHDR